MNARVWWARFSALFQRQRLEQDLDQDIQEHLQMATEENLRRGMNAREAAEAARRSFGGAEQMKEEFRDQRGIPVFETFRRETRFAFRSLRRAPGFSALAILTLALGIGANSAIFSAVNALMFNPAGLTEASRVVVVRSRYDKLNLRDLVASYSNYKDVSESGIVSSAAIAKTGSFTYTGGSHPRRLAALQVSWRWFDVLGVRPAQGRVFTEEEDQPNNNHVVILSHAAWQRVFSGDPSIVGKIIELDQRPYRVIGVMKPEHASGLNELGGLSGSPHDVFVPLGVRADTPQALYSETYLLLARLRSGISFAKAQTYMGVLTDRGLQVPVVGPVRKENGWGLSMVPYTDYVGGDMKTPVLILWGAVGFVLLIACSNIAGLTLARASARSRELAVRAALGGSRWHLLRQMFAESLLLALAGSVLGLGVAYGLIRGVQIWGSADVVGGLKIPFDVTMLVFTAAAGLVSGVVFGIAPASQLARIAASDALKEGGRSHTAGPNRLRLRSILVIAEVALALVLSIGCGLLLRSLSRLQQVDIGFRPEGVMSASVTLPNTRYKEPERQLAFYRGVIEGLKAIPGVKSAAAVYPLPFGAGYEGRAFQIVGRPIRTNEPAMQAQVRVTPEFFSTLRIPVIRGRAFTEEDAMGSERVAVIDESLAQQYWPGEDPLGQHIRQGVTETGVDSTIVGIVGHTKQSDLSGSEKGVFYYAFYQDPVPIGTFIVQASGKPEALAVAMQEAVSAADPAQLIFDPKSMDQRVSATLSGRRFTIVLLGLFAVMAVFLAALGLYGVINYGVTQRTQEIGIRVALGARRIQVLSLILGTGMRITLTGLAIGWLVAFQIARLLPNQLFGVNAFDPATFSAMACLMAVVTLFASYLPARRAMKLDPVEACRYE